MEQLAHKWLIYGGKQQIKVFFYIQFAHKIEQVVLFCVEF